MCLQKESQEQKVEAIEGQEIDEGQREGSHDQEAATEG